MTDLFLHGKCSVPNSSVTGTGNISFGGNDSNLGDTVLRLDFVDYGVERSGKGVYYRSHNDDFLSAQDDGCKLVLGLGPTPTSYNDGYCSSAVSKTKESISLLSESVISESDSGLLKLGLSRDISVPILDASQGNSDSLSDINGKSLFQLVVDEGSTSAKKSGGYMPSLIFAPRMENFSNSNVMQKTQHVQDQPKFSPEPSSTTQVSDSLITDAIPHEKTYKNQPRKCGFKGCTKGARGSSGLCIAHGGGQRCQKPGCNKGSESRTAFCKAHGGGRRCQMLGCTKSAEGKTDYCIAHGGGRRCGHPGCTKAARGKSGLCIRHGGGKRCTKEGCSRSAEGQAGLCISHGGGRRCQYQGCSKGAQGSTMYCKAHGGGKRCIFEGCTKGAEGSTPLCKGHGGGKRCLFEGGGLCPKSVHGGTDFCVAHGGGKRCAVTGCTKSARGRTDCCVKHGGGKRCHFNGCGKSAQGSTDFCKAHGGGKRCTFPGGCEKFARGKSGLCAAHGSKMALQQDQNGPKNAGMIGTGLFKGIVLSSMNGNRNVDNEQHSSSTASASAISECNESANNALEKQQLIPHRLLVPISMKFRERERSTGLVIPEGRVHGGGLMSLFGGNLKNSVDSAGLR